MKYTLLECQFAALMHDVGKFTQRTRAVSDLTENEKLVVPVHERGYYTHLHTGYTYRFFNDVLNRKDELELMTSLHHKNEDDELAKIIKRADCIASAIDRNDEIHDEEKKNKKGRFITSRLHNIFYEVDFGKDRVDAQYGLNSIEKLGYPVQNYAEKNIIKSADEYNQLYKKFEQEVKQDIYSQQIDLYTINRMYALLFKYFTSVPASTYEGNRTYVSLFDHLKLTAAIAGCLYLNKNHEENFYMYEFDISGIQKFIYKVVEGSNTKPGIAKALRGRSIFINLLTNAVTYSILNEFGLHASNIIFNTGGGGMILLPCVEDVKERVSKVEIKIKKEMLKLFAHDITFVSALVDMNANELELFKTLKSLELKSKLDEAKLKKFNEFMADDDFYITESDSQNICDLCGMVTHNSKRCAMCSVIESISEYYTKNDDFQIIYSFNKEMSKVYDPCIVDLGFVTVILTTQIDKECLSNAYVESVNNEKLGNVRFNANLVPKKNGQIKNFQEIAEEIVPSEFGDKKLAILKMDVDNLGVLFAFGLKENPENPILQRSISKYLTLSRLLELFFGKYLKDICVETSKKLFSNIQEITDNSDMFYVNYAGGDDLVIIGPAYGIIQLSHVIEEKFCKFVLNSNITISGGIHIQNDKSPIRFGIQRADDMLELSKSAKGKHHISVMDTSLEFDEFVKLLKRVEEYREYMEDKKISRTNLYNLMLMANEKGYEEFLREIPIIQYSLFRNIDSKNEIVRKEILRDFSSVTDNDSLKKMVLLMKLAIMFTRDK